MKTKTIVAGLYGVSVLASLAVVGSFLDFLKGREKYLKAGQPTIPGGAARPRELAPQRPFEAFANLHGLNVTGKEEAGALPDAELMGPDQPVASALADFVRVAYVQFDAETPAESRAFVRYLKDESLNKEENWFTVGDRLSDRLPPPHTSARVLEILPEKVVFEIQSGTDEVPVKTYEIAASAVGAVQGVGPGEPIPIPAPAATPREERTAWPAETKEVRPNQWAISQVDALLFERDYAQILGTDLRTVPNWPKGSRQPNGVRITSIRSGSAVDGKGLQAGDVVRAVNGSPVSSIQQVIDFGRSHPDLRTVTLDVERLGRSLTIQYQLPR